nr:SpvB/TcaC N-terminal domain-containing protein [Aliiroseovarius sp. S1339]
MPSGGGAIRSIGETFKANPATGTASFTVPLPLSPARALTPELALVHDSGNGMSSFGLGWDVPVPQIHRRASKRLPDYDNGRDIFSILGGEGLVRVTGIAGTGLAQENSRTYQIARFRPRIDSTHDQIEMWVDRASGEGHWRMWSSGNVVSVFGLTAAARVFNPADPTQVFAWQLERQFDALGNLTVFEYARENHAGIDFNEVSEAHRSDRAPATNYLKRVRYGNRTPFDGVAPPAQDFCFTLLFDYGDHDVATPGDAPVAEWSVRPDPFSRYDAGFERRYYRRCQRVLMLHSFPELGTDPEPVRALEILHKEAENGLSLISGVRSLGYQRDDSNALIAQRAPRISFEYQSLTLNGEARPVTTGTGSAISGAPRQQWQDLMSEGLPGLVREAGEALLFRRNLGDGRLGIEQTLARQFSLRGLGGVQTIETLAGGRTVVHRDRGIASLAQLGDDGLPGLARSFAATPTGGTSGRQLRYVDLIGDGLADVLQTDGDFLYWYPSRGVHGHGKPRRLQFPLQGARKIGFLFDDKRGRVFLADMSGDGLTDVVRVENGRVFYWPNLGHGRFADPVQMRDAPLFDRPDQFDPARIRLGDIDGSGLADLLYLGRDGPSLWLNRAGNGWTARQALPAPFPATTRPADIELADVSGSGTAALVWKNTPGAGAELHYAELTGGVKPYLLSHVDNGMGAETRLSYSPSTDFYLQDEASGRPWSTRLPFPVHCLARSEQIDNVSGLSFTSVYTYHHGAYDTYDREFRGFARVDQTDKEVLAETGDTDHPGRPFIQPPILTKTWFHTGVTTENGDLGEVLAGEFYSHPALPLITVPPVLPDNIGTRDWREAQRAMRGAVLRQEIYTLDDTPQMAHPYTITSSQYRLEMRQPSADPADGVEDGCAVFQRLDGGTINLELDRRPEDPRISQSIVLDWNAFGQPLRSASVASARTALPDDLPPAVAAAQSRTHILMTEQVLADARIAENAAIPNSLWQSGRARSLPRPVEEVVEELSGLSPDIPTTAADMDDGFSRAAIRDYSEGPGPGITRRVLSRRRTLYLNDDLTTPLNLGQDGSLGMVYRTEQLAFTPQTLTELYGDKVDAALLDQARYIHSLDASGVPDTGYWAPSGTQIFGSDAPARFYMPLGTKDPFGAETLIELDGHHLLPVRATNAVGLQTRALNDYRVLAPRAVRDENLNWTVATFDALGQVSAVARMGKVASTDAPTGHEPCEGDTLDHPSVVHSYDMQRWVNEQRPVRASTTSHTTYHHQNPGVEPRQTLTSHAYADGTGNVIMTKVQAAPGPAQQIAENGNLAVVDTSALSPPALRWVGNGRTIYNNKGAPLRTFEPYFSTTPEFENDPQLVEQGPSTLNFYDAAGRGIGAFHADGTWVKTSRTAWRSEDWDAADTCLIADPTADAELGGHFAGLPPELVHPLWFSARAGGALGADAQVAALASGEHAATPACTHSDALGRAIWTDTMPEQGVTLTVQSELDVEGNLLSVTDARANEVVRHGYGMTPGREGGKSPLYQSSMDAGERWQFPDVLGRTFMTWDARGHMQTSEFDIANRPVGQRLTLPDGSERRVAAIVYGTDQVLNTAGRPIEVWDQSGLARTLAFDFSGNITETERRFAFPVGPSDPIDWGDDPRGLLGVLSDEVFVSRASYDALGRVTEWIAPHTDSMKPSVTRPTYDEGGALDQMRASVPGMGELALLEHMTYDAKGQRQNIRYGNSVTTAYEYERTTCRLSRLMTTRDSDSATLQDLSFTYDAVGNITAQRDHAQQSVFFNNQVVEAHSTFRHDALYRLTEATGREHIDQAGLPDWQSGWASQTHPEDGARMRTYAQRYVYDAAGNLTQIRHTAGAGSWTRNHSYEASSNRLASTQLGTSAIEVFTHNAHGSMTAMAHLSAMDWDFAERLVRVDKGIEGHAEYTYDANGQRVRKRRIFPDGRVAERLYFNGFEIYREMRGDAIEQERETLQVSDDSGQIALLETATVVDGTRLTSPQPLTRYQLGNHLGSAVLELDEAAALISYEEYHPYGTTAYHAVTTAREVPEKRYRYTGKERDEETGLTYHGARYYAPWLARWTAADPIGIGDGLNVYAYVGGRPIVAADPTGLGDSLINDLVENPEVRRGPTISAMTEEQYIWYKYFDRIAGGLPPTEEARLSGEMITQQVLHSTSEWYRDRERFERYNADALAEARANDAMRAEHNALSELAMTEGTFIPINNLNEDQLTDLIGIVGGGPLLLFSGQVAEASTPGTTLTGVSAAQVFQPGPVEVVDFGGQGRVPPNARVLAQIVQSAVNQFAANPTSVQHYLSPGQARAYSNQPQKLGGLFVGIGIENYSASYVSTIPDLRRRISSVGGPNAPDNIVGMGSRPSPQYAFTDTHPRGTDWGRLHTARFYLNESSTGIAAFGIQYDPFPSWFHTQATSSRPPGWTPRFQNQIRNAPLVQPSRRARR